jgi:hypothetical protein
LFFSQVYDSLRRFVVVAVATAVPFQPALLAHFRLAFFALAHLAAGRLVGSNVFGLDPSSAVFGWTVQAVFCGVFCELAVPSHFERCIEQLVDVAERDHGLGAAARWHELRVSC